MSNHPFLKLPSLFLLLLIAGCSITDSDNDGFPLSAFVYYDENGNDVQDMEEQARVPGVKLFALGHPERAGTAQAGTGQVSIPSVPSGEQTLVADESSLPPYFEARRGVLVRVPQTSPVYFPVTLPIGDNVPHRYMAFGDSITDGEGGFNDTGYREQLRQRLQDYFGRGEVINEGEQGSVSSDGALRIGACVDRWHPAYTLIMYGTNDWYDNTCTYEFPCFTIDSLRAIVRRVHAASSLPFVATIPPANPADPRISPARNDWVTQMNVLVRQMAIEEGAVLVDIHAAMLRTGDLSALFSDHVHPNDSGYEIMTNEFFRAITQPQAPTASASIPPP